MLKPALAIRASYPKNTTAVFDSLAPSPSHLSGAQLYVTVFLCLS